MPNPPETARKICFLRALIRNREAIEAKEKLISRKKEKEKEMKKKKKGK